MRNTKTFFIKIAVFALCSFAFLEEARADELTRIAEHIAYNQRQAVWAQSSLMFFNLDIAGQQTLFGAAANGLNGGDACSSGICYGNLHIKTFASSNKVDIGLTNGIKPIVENLGFIAGFSSDRIYDSFDARYMFFAGYTYSRQKWNSKANNQTHNEENTPVAGVSAEFYKGNFFTSFVLNGAYVHSRTMQAGDEDTSSNSPLGALGMKLGYNFKLPLGISLQPSGRAAYTYLDMEDFEVSGIGKIKTHLYNAAEFVPGLKAGLDLGKCWSINAFGDYVWLYGNKQEPRVDRTAEDKIHYVEYGFGLVKEWRSFVLYANAARSEGDLTGWYASINGELRF